jgi:hypothetical protein
MTKNEIIHTYIDNHLLNGVYPEECSYKVWSRNGVCIFMYMESHMLLQVKLSVWDELHNMFSLTGEETKSLFKDWAIRNLGLPQDTLVISTGMFI